MEDGEKLKNEERNEGQKEGNCMEMKVVNGWGGD